MTNEIENTQAYKNNEVNANRQMTFALMITAILLFFVWFGYFFGVFDVSHNTWLVTIIIIPIVILLIIFPIFLIKTKLLANPRYKFFILFQFVLGISILNVIMPKHAVLGWAVCIILTAHYYNPKVSHMIFITVIFMMLISMGFGTFYGEFDSNLLGGELNKTEQIITNFRLTDGYADTPSGRYDYLKNLILVGENRFVKIFTQYFLGRALFVTIIFIVTARLNKRTKILLNNEINVSNEYQKNRTELEVAKEIQLGTLPKETISSKDVEIVCELKAVKEVGGDLYDYVDIDENHVAILIGDVSGKGVPAAMFMMKTITSFRDFAVKDKNPSQILKEVNASIYKGNESSLFVTCFLAIIDKRDGKVVFANAGHNPPVIGSNGNFHYLKCSSGFLLGCYDEAFVKDEEFYLNPGDSITLYTDGITESRNISGELFGEERLLQVMNKHKYTCVVELHHAIKEEIASFVKEAPQSDDITFLTLKYRGDHYSYKERNFDLKQDNIATMLEFVNNFGDEHQFPEDFKNKLAIVSDELLSNIIKYGYENNDGNIFVRLLFDEDKKEFGITIIDKAKPFNQLAVNNPTLDANNPKQKIGGLGLIIVKKIMDEYAYDRINGKNILVLKKKF